MLSDEHKLPFAVFAAVKHGSKQHVSTVGDVTEVMDKSIGRLTYQIRGIVSANNYLSMDRLHLMGRYLHLQVSFLRPSTTIHMDVMTTDQFSLRLTFSTMYSNEKPKFLGRSLRLPLPLSSNQQHTSTAAGGTGVGRWMILCLDMKEILNQCCRTIDRQKSSIGEFAYLRRIQFCSNLNVRELVSHDESMLSMDSISKELTVKPAGETIYFVDMMSYISSCAGGGEKSSTRSRTSESTPSRQMMDHELEAPVTPLLMTPSIPPLLKESPMKDDELAVPTTFPEPILPSSNPIGKDASRQPIATSRPLSSSRSTSRPRSTAGSKFTPRAMQQSIDSTRKPISKSRSGQFSGSELFDMSPGPAAQRGGLYASSASRSLGASLKTNSPVKSRHTPLSSLVASSTLNVHNTPTAPIDRLLRLERMLGYSGGPSTLLSNGRLLLFTAGNHLVLVDLDRTGAELPTTGFWCAFRLGIDVKDDSNCQGGVAPFRQAILRGHSAPITLLDVSGGERLLVTAEGGAAGLIIIWDLVEGCRVASLRPYTGAIVALSLNYSGSELVTAGLDGQGRCQIIVWDLNRLLLHRLQAGASPGTATCLSPPGIQPPAGTESAATSSTAAREHLTSCIIARQVSEFAIRKLRFSPFDEGALVSCGRENVRLWRIRKQCLPGRPVRLGDYSRGHHFVDLAFQGGASDLSTSSGSGKKNEKNPEWVYVACENRGVVLRIDYRTEQVLCAFSLHGGVGIASLALSHGYAVSGGNDSRLRLWPTNFSDFLLEARHEGPVTSVSMGAEGRKLLVGTSAGTLGVLSVAEHSYETILRSHVGAILSITRRPDPPASSQLTSPTAASLSEKDPFSFTQSAEMATIGIDQTIRVWQMPGGTQSVEFHSASDPPTAVVYHPTAPLLVCGFKSGCLRVFDLDAAISTAETQCHGVGNEVFWVLAWVVESHVVLSSLPVGATWKTVGWEGDGSVSSAPVLVLSAGADGYLSLAQWLPPGTEGAPTGRLEALARVRFANSSALSSAQRAVGNGGSLRGKVHVSISPDFSLVAVSCGDVESVALWHLPSLAPAFQVVAGVINSNGVNSPQRKSRVAHKDSSPMTKTYSDSLPTDKGGDDSESSDDEEGQEADAKISTPSRSIVPSSTVLPSTPLNSVAASAGRVLTISPLVARSPSSSTKGDAGSNGVEVVSLSFLQQPSLKNLNSLDDSPSNGTFLLITTSRHFIVVPLDTPHTTLPLSSTGNSSGAFNNTAGVALVKKIDFGEPTNVSVDPKSGLLFIALRDSNSSSRSSTRSLASSTFQSTGSTFSRTKSRPTKTDSIGGQSPSIRHAFAALSLRILNTAQGSTRLALSHPQVYGSSPGEVITVCPMLSVERVVSIDQSGCLSIWRVQAAPLLRLLRESLSHDMNDHRSMVAANSLVISNSTWQREYTNTIALESAFEESTEKSNTEDIECNSHAEPQEDSHDCENDGMQWEEQSPGPGDSYNAQKDVLMCETSFHSNTRDVEMGDMFLDDSPMQILPALDVEEGEDCPLIGTPLKEFDHDNLITEFVESTEEKLGGVPSLQKSSSDFLLLQKRGEESAEDELSEIEEKECVRVSLKSLPSRDTEDVVPPSVPPLPSVSDPINFSSKNIAAYTEALRSCSFQNVPSTPELQPDQELHTSICSEHKEDLSSLFRETVLTPAYRSARVRPVTANGLLISSDGTNVTVRCLKSLTCWTLTPSVIVSQMNNLGNNLAAIEAVGLSPCMGFVVAVAPFVGRQKFALLAWRQRGNGLHFEALPPILFSLSNNAVTATLVNDLVWLENQRVVVSFTRPLSPDDERLTAGNGRRQKLIFVRCDLRIATAISPSSNGHIQGVLEADSASGLIIQSKLNFNVGEVIALHALPSPIPDSNTNAEHPFYANTPADVLLVTVSSAIAAIELPYVVGQEPRMLWLADHSCAARIITFAITPAVYTTDGTKRCVWFALRDSGQADFVAAEWKTPSTGNSSRLTLQCRTASVNLPLLGSATKDARRILSSLLPVNAGTMDSLRLILSLDDRLRAFSISIANSGRLCARVTANSLGSAVKIPFVARALAILTPVETKITATIASGSPRMRVATPKKQPAVILVSATGGLTLVTSGRQVVSLIPSFSATPDSVFGGPVSPLIGTNYFVNSNSTSLIAISQGGSLTTSVTASDDIIRSLTVVSSSAHLCISTESGIVTLIDGATHRNITRWTIKPTAICAVDLSVASVQQKSFSQHPLNDTGNISLVAFGENCTAWLCSVGGGLQELVKPVVESVRMPISTLSEEDMYAILSTAVPAQNVVIVSWDARLTTTLIYEDAVLSGSPFTAFIRHSAPDSILEFWHTASPVRSTPHSLYLLRAIRHPKAAIEATSSEYFPASTPDDSLAADGLLIHSLHITLSANTTDSNSRLLAIVASYPPDNLAGIDPNIHWLMITKLPARPANECELLCFYHRICLGTEFVDASFCDNFVAITSQEGVSILNLATWREDSPYVSVLSESISALVNSDSEDELPPVIPKTLSLGASHFFATCDRKTLFTGVVTTLEAVAIADEHTEDEEDEQNFSVEHRLVMCFKTGVLAGKVSYVTLGDLTVFDALATGELYRNT